MPEPFETKAECERALKLEIQRMQAQQKGDPSARQRPRPKLVCEEDPDFGIWYLIAV